MKTIKNMTEENLNTLAKIIRDSVSVSDIVDDNTYSTKMSMSSSRLQELLTNVSEDVQEFANSLKSRKRVLTIQEINEAPTIDNTELNVIYIYQNTDTNFPEQWMKFNNETLMQIGGANIGSIDLSGFHTKEQANEEFALKSAIQPFIDFINNFTPTENYNTITEAINYFNGLITNNSSSSMDYEVVIEINDEVTDNQVATSLATKKYVDSKTCCPILTDTNGVKYQMSVDDEGNIGSTVITS